MLDVGRRNLVKGSVKVWKIKKMREFEHITSKKSKPTKITNYLTKNEKVRNIF